MSKQTSPLTAERLAEIRARLASSRRLTAVADWPEEDYAVVQQQQRDVVALLAEVDRARAAEDAAQRRYITDTADLKRRLDQAVQTIRTDADLRETEGETELAAYGRELADLIAPDKGATAEVAGRTANEESKA